MAFDAPLLKPLRFREAVSALHDVVISDLRFKKKDKTAYLEWKKNEEQRLAEMRRVVYQQLHEQVAVKHEVPADLQRRYNTLRKRYWSARVQYSDYLRKHDVDLWRMLMPCDPVVTVAEDVLLFECFSADESSYGCLSVNREDGVGKSDGVQLGTTNVDYSWTCTTTFSRSARTPERVSGSTPGAFEVKTRGAEGRREEKIDLPTGWLRGFMQLQSAMGLPTVRVSLGREAVYSILAWLKRHRRDYSPRAIRFELSRNAHPRIVLEPWELPIAEHDVTYDGPGHRAHPYLGPSAAPGAGAAFAAGRAV